MLGKKLLMAWPGQQAASGPSYWDSWTLNSSSSNYSSYGRIIYMSPDGTSVYILSASSNQLDQYYLSTPYDLSSESTPTPVSSRYSSFQIYGLHFSSDGNTFYLSTSNNFEEYAASSPFSLNGSLNTNHTFYRNSFGAQTESVSPKGFTFSADGTKLLILQNGSSGGTFLYRLNTAWSISLGTVDVGVNGEKIPYWGTPYFDFGPSHKFYYDKINPIFAKTSGLGIVTTDGKLSYHAKGTATNDWQYQLDLARDAKKLKTSTNTDITASYAFALPSQDKMYITDTNGQHYTFILSGGGGGGGGGGTFYQYYDNNSNYVVVEFLNSSSARDNFVSAVAPDNNFQLDGYNSATANSQILTYSNAVYSSIGSYPSGPDTIYYVFYNTSGTFIGSSGKGLGAGEYTVL